MSDFSFIEAFSSTRILCLGDVMLDFFVRGSISRISPEAPIPILRIQEETVVLGGAGNVVRNLEALGSSVTFLSVVGNDQNGTHIQDLLKKSPRVTSHLLVDETRPTTTKTRFIAANQQILRTDSEQIFPLSQSLEKQLVNHFRQNLASHDLVIFSDYAKGIFSPKGIQTLLQEAKAQGKPVLVDPKGHDFLKYKGATYLTPNRQELLLATGSGDPQKEDLVSRAQKVLKMCGLEGLILTRGAEGMTLVDKAGAVEQFPTQALEVFDVSGAGDTVVATLAVSLAAGVPLSKAMHLANTAAGLVVSKVGTAVVQRDELGEALHHQEFVVPEQKVISWQRAHDQVQKWKRLGQRVVFTNGCFDLLHPGHIALLTQAKRAGDRLIVGLNTDQSIQRLKGPSRPIQPEMARAFVLSSLETVDLVVLFEEDTPLKLIQTLKPDVLVKGADYTIDQVVGASFVQSNGGKVLLVDLIEGHSTTQIAARMRA